MLQRDNLLEWRTILSNVLFGLEIRGAKTPQNVARARSCSKTLYGFRHKYPRQLSGGMRQRVALSSAHWPQGRISCCWTRRFRRWIIRRA